MILSASIGAFFGGPLSERHGRKKIMFIADFVMILAMALTIIENYAVIVTGRFILGVVVGLNSAIGPLYLIEMAPKEMRG